nr:ATP-binding protein [Aneurinibacillus tyrosinisolvens]
MVYNRVVVKLWITILGLVAVVLTVLSLTLMQFFDGFYEKQRTSNLVHLAQNMADVLNVYQDQEQTVHIARELLNGYGTRMVVINSAGEFARQKFSSVNPDIPEVDAKELMNHPALKKAFSGNVGTARSLFTVVPNNGGAPHKEEFLAVSVPLHSSLGKNNELILYQTLDELRQTMSETSWFIFYAAVIGIILTTFFAFFLSTRITQPLRTMKKAADSYSHGDFTAQIPIRTNDEIGELAGTFNHMARRLNDLILALSREKEEISSVLKSMVDGVITVDRQGNIIVTNPPADSILKAWSFEQGETEQQEDRLNRGLPEFMRSILDQVVKNEQDVISDVMIQGRIYALVMGPLYDNNQVRGAVAVMRDMTQERKLDKLRKDFLANVSHELRTPLVMLQGYSEAIIDDIAPTQEEKKELAQIIYDESVRMSRLVNELLDLARMEAGHIELNIEQMNLLQLEDKVIRKFNGVVKEQGKRLQLDWDSSQDTFYLDADRMEQVLTNLIDNAIRHTSSGGTVTLRTVTRGDRCTIEVSDTGSGIPAEDLPFVFERFYKADKARTRRRGGTGLGLSIVKNIVQAHGGTITVHSKLGEGTTFSIDLFIHHEEGSVL